MGVCCADKLSRIAFSVQIAAEDRGVFAVRVRLGPRYAESEREVGAQLTERRLSVLCGIHRKD